MALVPRPVSSIASDPFSACDTVPRPRSSSEPRPSSVRHRSAAQRLRPRGGFFGWHWSPDQCLRSRAVHSPRAPQSPTTFFERASAILRAPQVPRPASSFWVALVPRPVSSIASDPSSAYARSPTIVFERANAIFLCARSAAERLRPRGGIFLGGTGPPTSVFDRERPIHRVLLADPPPSVFARAEAFLGGTGPPTSVFNRGRPIHCLPQARRPASSLVPRPWNDYPKNSHVNP